MGVALAAPVITENSLGMKLVLIPAGEFNMGSDEAIEALRAAYPQMVDKRFDELRDEAPRHPVQITRAFFLG
jgi:formylglycine-generating enzyme required for sulfatase activity